MVGAVLVRDGRVVGEGFHRRPGEPHAEILALAGAGERARGATLFVNLEPCSHHGRTPPCADALVAAGIARVVACHRDPDPRVSGRGFDLLRQAGIAVEVGASADAAVELNFRFLVNRVLSRPQVTLKWAMSLDGKIATVAGESQWISGTAARRWALALREEHDAILVGVGTVLADDPRLDRRLGRAGGPILRVVLDRRLRTPLAAKLFEVPGPVVIYSESRDAARFRELSGRGAEVVRAARGHAGDRARRSRRTGGLEPARRGGPRYRDGLLRRRALRSAGGGGGSAAAGRTDGPRTARGPRRGTTCRSPFGRAAEGPKVRYGSGAVRIQREMFTGIVRELGTLIAAPANSGQGGVRLLIGHSAELGRLLAPGASLGVSGVCLTVLDTDARSEVVSEVELSRETLARTRLGRLRSGDRVNLEPALRAGDPLGGHWVQGHVDTVATLVRRDDREAHSEFTVAIPRGMASYVVEKGSVALDGVSLTVASCSLESFTVALIPHTLEVTTLGGARPGSRFHFEADVLAKYVERMLLVRGLIPAPVGSGQGS